MSPAPRLPLVLCLLAAGCSPTRIPPLPESFDTVVLTSDLAPTKLYADALAAFLRAGWESLPDERDGLTLLIQPEGSAVEAGGNGLVLRVDVLPIGGEPTEPVPDLADADYAGPDLSRRALNDPARGQNEADSLRRAARAPDLTTGDAVLTAFADPANPEAREALIRTARILAAVSGTLSYR